MKMISSQTDKAPNAQAKQFVFRFQCQVERMPRMIYIVNSLNSNFLEIIYTPLKHILFKISMTDLNPSFLFSCLLVCLFVSGFV